MQKILSIKLCIFIGSALFLTSSLHAQTKTGYDIVLTGGRVIDPETGLDTIKNVAISKNRIVEISSFPLKGKETIDVSGLVVAPGFIDLHVHGTTNKEQEYQLHDGVTTALELEWGIGFLGEWYASRKGKALINYGASVNWGAERFLASQTDDQIVKELKGIAHTTAWSLEAMNKRMLPFYRNAQSPAEIEKTLQNVRNTLAAGAIGIGLPIAYLPGAGTEEVFRLYQLAGELKATIFTHVREGGIMAVQQSIADAVLTGAPLHIVHINSSTLGNIKLAIEMVQTAKAKGYEISTELYPYTAGSTSIESALFDEGWQKRLDISYSDLQWVATGERLTKETFEAYRKTGGMLILHSMKAEWIAAGIAAKGTSIGSDGMPYAPLAHPRTAGTFSRVLGKYVREDKVLDLPTALAKMSLLPAKRLELISPMMRFKGRLQVGADADITIFDASKIIDKATFEKGLAFSEGIQYVLVNGVVALRNGKTVEQAFAGEPVFGKYKQ